jgi:hypothetical protein
MIRLGMTDCPAVRSLLERGGLTLDYLEVHGPYVESARQVYPDMPMLLHNALYQWSLAHPDGLQHKDCAVITRQRLERTRSPWYSLHLGFSAAEVDFIGNAMDAVSPVLPPEVIFERTCAALQDLRARLGPEFPILVENLDYNPTGAYETVCRPDFIQNVLAASGVELLLDLAHARISAAALGLSVEPYLDQLPLEKVRQIHVNRPLWNGQRWWDAHADLMDDDYRLLEWTLQRCQPWSVTLEYNQNEALILTQVQHLRNILAGRPLTADM